jgi:hypothetical protein
VSIHLQLNDAALDRLLNQTTGEVGDHLKKIGRRIKAGAAVTAGKDTGSLVRKLYMEQGRRGRYQYVEVGSKSSHAYMHHEGTRRHRIIPNTGRVLRFNVGGMAVFAMKVNHPGTKPNKYLTTPMRKVLR